MLVGRYGVSRQYVVRLLKELVREGKLVKVGVTRSAFYASPELLESRAGLLPERIMMTLDNVNLEEHVILDRIEQRYPQFKRLKENIRSIFTYAFSEMLNNAIEHSQSKKIKIEVFVRGGLLSFVVDDAGIGVFRNVMQKKGLKSELEAIQDILKGKTTTMPKSHSGEGIFFTSKVGNAFILESFGYQLIVDNALPDVFIRQTEKAKKGTRVMFGLDINSSAHLNDVFMKYANSENGGYGFTKTEIRVKLYTIGGVHISRSQARRVLAGLEKFRSIMFDFEQVPMIGQAFADEIFRVFHHIHPEIKLEVENANEAVRFMIERAKNSA